MPRHCLVCDHDQRADIDARLVEGNASLREIGALFGVSGDSLKRHAARHLPAALVAAKDAEAVAHGDNLLAKVGQLEEDARRIQKRAEDANDLKTALLAVGKLVQMIELQARLLGELRDAPTVNVNVSAEWREIRAVIVATLVDYPEAADAVGLALLRLDHARA